MDAVRARLIEFGDELYLAFQTAARSFAFLPDGRDHVEVIHGANRLVVRLPDHADEGWPAVEASLPADAKFVHGHMGMLSRGGTFTVPRAPVDVVADLGESLDLELRSTFDGNWCALVGDEAWLTMSRGHAAPTIITLRQRRDPDAIGEVLRARAERKSRERASEAGPEAVDAEEMEEAEG